MSSTSSSGKLWQTNCAILNTEIDGVEIDINDLRIARQHIINQALNLPPSRGTYLRYAIIFELFKLEDQPTTYEGSDIHSLCKSLKIQYEDEKQLKRIKKYLQRSVEEKLVKEANGKYKGSARYKSTWSRIKKMVTIVGDQIFYGDKNPFVIVQGGQNKAGLI